MRQSIQVINKTVLIARQYYRKTIQSLFLNVKRKDIKNHFFFNFYRIHSLPYLIENIIFHIM